MNFKQPTQLIIAAHNCHIGVIALVKISYSILGVVVCRSGEPDIYFFDFSLSKCGWIQNRLTWKRAVFFWYLRPVSFLIVISLRTQGTGHLHRKSIASSLWKFPKIWRIFAKPYSIFFLVLFLPSSATNFLGCWSVNFCKWSYRQIFNLLFEVSLLYVHSMLSTI